MNHRLGGELPLRARLRSQPRLLYFVAPARIIHATFLLWTRSNELAHPDEIGKQTEFDNGPVYRSPQGGAHQVLKYFLAVWARAGY